MSDGHDIPGFDHDHDFPPGTELLAEDSAEAGRQS